MKCRLRADETFLDSGDEGLCFTTPPLSPLAPYRASMCGHLLIFSLYRWNNRSIWKKCHNLVAIHVSCMIFLLSDGTVMLGHGRREELVWKLEQGVENWQEGWTRDEEKRFMENGQTSLSIVQTGRYGVVHIDAHKQTCNHSLRYLPEPLPAKITVNVLMKIVRWVWQIFVWLAGIGSVWRTEGKGLGCMKKWSVGGGCVRCSDQKKGMIQK